MEKRIVTFFMLMVCAIGAMAQQLSVQCQVNDSKGEGVPFATILQNSSIPASTTRLPCTLPMATTQAGIALGSLCVSSG